MTTERGTYRRAAEAQRQSPDGPGLLQVFTLVVWIVWLLVGVLGWWLSRATPAPSSAPPPKALLPVQAELLEVQFMGQPVAADTAPPDQALPSPEMAAPPLPAVAAFTPAIPFAVPIEGAVRVVTAQQANLARIPIEQKPAVRRLTSADVAGKLAKPDYPAEARILGQQGTVGVRFTVDPDGSVVSAQVIAPSFPSLNEAALQTVRNQWHFGAGSRRIFDYYFVFRLNQT
jgi:TonB family protein